MNVQKVVRNLNERHPGKDVVLNTSDNQEEIICEVNPGKKKSLAIAVIDKTKPHYHNKLTVTYEIIEGKLTFYMDGKKRRLSKGDKIVIKPGVVHWAKGDETWVKVYSEPGWTPEDHIDIQKEDYSKKGV